MKRFGATVLRDGFTCLPNVLLLHLGKLKLSRTEFTIIAEIWQCWWSTWPFPKVGTIATRLGVSRRAVQLQLARLKAPMIEEDLQAREDGEVEIVSRVIRPAYVTITSRYNADRGQTSNVYDFTPLLVELEMIQCESDEHSDSQGCESCSQDGANQTPRNSANQTSNVIEEDEDVDSNDSEYVLRTSIPSEVDRHVDNFSRPPHDELAAPMPHRSNTPPTSPNQTENTRLYRNRESRTPPDGAQGVGANKQAFGTNDQLYGWPRSPGVERYITDLSSEWHDREHLPQNLSQALRLCYELGAEHQFYELIGLARRKTNKANIRALKHNGRPNRMPYFFTILRQHVEAEINCQIADGERSPDWLRQLYPEGVPK